MPIKPENKELYPREWRAIAAEVREREGNACKVCRVPNGKFILRSRDRKTYSTGDCEFYDAETGEYLGCTNMPDNGEGDRAIKIVLTVAHLNHDTTDNGKPGNRPNLAALCQMHHLRHDQAHHQKNAAATRDRKRAEASGMGDLFT